MQLEILFSLSIFYIPSNFLSSAHAIITSSFDYSKKCWNVKDILFLLFISFFTSLHSYVEQASLQYRSPRTLLSILKCACLFTLFLVPDLLVCENAINGTSKKKIFKKLYSLKCLSRITFKFSIFWKIQVNSINNVKLTYKVFANNFYFLI